MDFRFLAALGMTGVVECAFGMMGLEGLHSGYFMRVATLITWNEIGVGLSVS